MGNIDSSPIAGGQGESAEIYGALRHQIGRAAFTDPLAHCELEDAHALRSCLDAMKRQGPDLLTAYPELLEHYDEFVPLHLSSEDFWLRYLYSLSQLPATWWRERGEPVDAIDNSLGASADHSTKMLHAAALASLLLAERQQEQVTDRDCGGGVRPKLGNIVRRDNGQRDPQWRERMLMKATQALNRAEALEAEACEASDDDWAASEGHHGTETTSLPRSVTSSLLQHSAPNESVLDRCAHGRRGVLTPREHEAMTPEEALEKCKTLSDRDKLEIKEYPRIYCTGVHSETNEVGDPGEHIAFR